MRYDARRLSFTCVRTSLRTSLGLLHTRLSLGKDLTPLSKPLAFEDLRLKQVDQCIGVD